MEKVRDHVRKNYLSIAFSYQLQSDSSSVGTAHPAYLSLYVGSKLLILKRKVRNVLHCLSKVDTMSVSNDAVTTVFLYITS